MDTGGYDIKTGGGMEKMRLDMTGAAVSMSAFEAIVKLGLPIRVHCIFAATENMISGEAQVAGKVIETMSGLSVEVVNTDAEGRLILADCIAYAKQFECDYFIDMATLTGAARQTTDDAGAVVFSNDHELVKKLGEAAYASGEFIQPMILFDSLRDRNRSPVADLKNSGGTPGHTTAAWFLAEFYEWKKKVSFAHFDIAGMSYRQGARGVYPGESASGWGVLLLVEFARMLSRQSK
jgi:leucyl aminopeptidase